MHVTDSRPATQHAAITPNDSTDLSNLGYRSVFVGGAGDITIKDLNGVSATYTVPAGVVIPISPSFIMDTNTDATNIIGLK